MTYVEVLGSAGLAQLIGKLSDLGRVGFDVKILNLDWGENVSGKPGAPRTAACV